MTENTRPEDLNGENSLNTPKKGETAMSSDEKERKRISRREFVKGAAVGAAGAAAAGALAGCGPEAPEVIKETVEVEKVVEKEVPVEVTKEVEVIKEVEVKPWLPEKWDRETDVVVVGSGAAGYSAACSAAEEGVSVLLLEKLPTIGGNSRVSGGNYGTYCDGVDDLEKRRMEEDPDWHVGDSPELYFQEKLAMGNYRSDPEVTKKFAFMSKEGYLWFKKIGFNHDHVQKYSSYTPIVAPPRKGLVFAQTYNAVYDDDGVWIGVFTKGRHHTRGTYVDADGNTWSSGEGAIFAMADEADRLGVELICEMQVTEIIRENLLSGDVLGVRVTDLANNKELTVRAKKGVILAAGGAHGNLEMVSHYDPRHTLTRTNTGATAIGDTTDGGKYGRGATDSSGAGATGEVLVAAMDIGADTNLLGEFQLRWDRSGVAYTGPFAVVPTSSSGKFIDIDGTGNRIWAEGGKTQTYQGKLTYVHVNNISTKFGEHTWFGLSDSGAVGEDRIQSAVETGNAFVADTLEELAEIIEVPAEALVATVERYNGFVDAGEDLDFHQDPAALNYKLETPPFIAFRKCYYRHTDMGGVRVNANFQVMDRRSQVIPGLYAAGETEGSTHGIQRDGGCGWTQCWVGGWTAGKHVASL
jgi:succinate dehydrogenase/fumarate reductase flavoprotein subunit